MITILIATAAHENLRTELRRVAVDHGLTQRLPFLFEGRLTAYRRQRLAIALKVVAGGRRAFHIECFAVTEASRRERIILSSNQ